MSEEAEEEVEADRKCMRTDGYLYGVSGPFWYGAGATFQIFMFALAGKLFLRNKYEKQALAFFYPAVQCSLHRLTQP